MSRPVAYRTRPAVVAWVDLEAAYALTGGRRITLPTGRPGFRPTLAATLSTLSAAGVTRAYLTGSSFPDRWATATPPASWHPAARGHYVTSDDPRLTFTREHDGYALELRRAASWFGAEATPLECSTAWHVLERALARAWHPGTGYPVLLATPGATGTQLWALAAPGNLGDDLDDDTAALIRSTSPQHRIEVPGSCYAGCDAHRPRPAEPLPVSYFDARFAYAALCSELGSGQPVRLTGRAATQLAGVNPYARARYHVRFAVPPGWAWPGLLMEPHPDGTHWHAPDVPGYVGQTWADSSEVDLALRYGWSLEFLEALAWPVKVRPLDVWRRRLVDVWRRLEADDEPLAARAVRLILLHTIGTFHSVGREAAHIAATPREVPASGVIRRRDLAGGRVLYHTRQTLTGAAASFQRPELSAQIWGRAHVRLAEAPVGRGFLELDPDATVGLYGDAIYCRSDAWLFRSEATPAGVGVYRLKGRTREPVNRPRSVAELLKLREVLL